MAINELLKEALRNSRSVYWYIAPTFRQAKDIVWKNPEGIFKYLPQEALDSKNEVELTIKLRNGSLIILKGGDNPDSLRGSRPRGIVIDEYGDMKSDVWETVLRPVMTAQEDGWVMFIGTPKGRNHFFRLFNLQGNGWKSWILKASESGVISQQALDQARTEMTDAAYKQEFECDFLDDATSVFKGIEQHLYFDETSPQQGRMYKLGCDLAKHNDWTVLTAIDLHTFRVLTPERFNRIDWDVQKARIEAFALRHNSGIMTIDSTGVGEPIYEDLMNKGVSVEPYHFTYDTRNNLLRNLVMLFEQYKISIPNFEPLINELKSFRYEVTGGGRTKMAVPDSLHDDCVMSLALACWNIIAPMPEPEAYSTNIMTFQANFN